MEELKNLAVQDKTTETIPPEPNQTDAKPPEAHGNPMSDDPLEGMTDGQIKEYLDRMRSVDIRTVDPDTLVDIRDVVINTDLPPKERVRDYIRQVKNPYCYKSHGMIVKLKFAGTETMEELLSRCVGMYS